MADQPTTTADQSTIVNGFDRLTAATQPTTPTPVPSPRPGPAPEPATTSAAPSQPTPTASTTDEGTADREQPDEQTPYRLAPHLLPEHALLGSLLHAPAALDQLEDFLGTRDFATPDTRAVYATLRGLHRAGALFDVAALPTRAEQLHAANENHLRLFQALRAAPPPFTTITIDHVPGLIAQLNAAAPPETLPFRGVYDPRAQLHLGRMVLEASCRRQLRAMGVLLHRAKPLVPPAATSPERAERAAHALATNLDHIHNQLDQLSARLVRAVSRTDQPAATSQQRPTTPPPRRRRLPDQLRPISAPLQHRAERHLLHLALHAGRTDLIPPEILNLHPQDFTSTRHANLWRTIKDLQAQGLPVNYVSVFHATRADGFTHHPMPSDRSLTRMAQPPQLDPARISRSLRILVTTALSRAAADTRRALNTLASTAAPVDTLLTEAKTTLDRLATRVTAATDPHQRPASQARPTHR